MHVIHLFFVLLRSSLAPAEQRGGKADRPPLFAAFFSREEGLGPIKGKVPPLDVGVRSFAGI